jgi:hypothetical protein
MFAGEQGGGHLPRYHFVVTWRDRVREYGNTEGTFLKMKKRHAGLPLELLEN